MPNSLTGSTYVSPHTCCWHSTHKVLSILPPQEEEVCCWCGQLRLVRPKPPFLNLQHHGVYHPMRNIKIQLPKDTSNGEQKHPEKE